MRERQAKTKMAAQQHVTDTDAIADHNDWIITLLIVYENQNIN